jgi:hypothetical protein
VNAVEKRRTSPARSLAVGAMAEDAHEIALRFMATQPTLHYGARYYETVGFLASSPISKDAIEKRLYAFLREHGFSPTERSIKMVMFALKNVLPNRAALEAQRSKRST